MAEATLHPPRQRLLEAMARSIERGGYRQSTVAEVVRIARTSRRTFYEHFADREACFLALFEQTTQAMLARIAAAVDPELPWERQVDQALDAYIAAIAEHPALHQSFARELPALGGAGAERQRLVLERFAAMLVELVEAARRRHPERIARGLAPEVAIVIVAGLRELLVSSLQRGREPAAMRQTARTVVRALLRELLAPPA
jgi:AcrR family transcriptional regulator